VPRSTDTRDSSSSWHVAPVGATPGLSAVSGSAMVQDFPDLALMEFGSVPGASENSTASYDAIPAHHGTRLQHGIRKPKVYTDGTVCYGFFSASVEPQHY
jgi:hypothetical protein